MNTSYPVTLIKEKKLLDCAHFSLIFYTSRSGQSKAGMSALGLSALGLSASGLSALGLSACISQLQQIALSWIVLTSSDLSYFV